MLISSGYKEGIGIFRILVLPICCFLFSHHGRGRLEEDICLLIMMKWSAILHVQYAEFDYPTESRSDISKS